MVIGFSLWPSFFNSSCESKFLIYNYKVMTKKQMAKQCAERDIKESLRSRSACFIAWWHELDSSINNIVEQFEEEQSHVE
jgi:hypothetical protein